MTSPIDIRPQDLATIRLHLERTLPQTAKIYVFGSRANWTTKNGSDLDLAIDAGSPLPQRMMVELADAFEESDLPYKVDVVDLQTVTPDFGARIRSTMVPLPSRRTLNSKADTWRRCKLGEILELKRGYDLPTADRHPGRIPLVSSSGVSDHIADAKVPGPGVVTGRYGTIGEVYFLNEPFWPLNTTLYVRDFKGNDPRFIAYLMKTLDFRAYSDKAAVPGLNRNHLHEAVIELPLDVGEQQAIASVLGTLDDKIELNRRMNETLEAMARAIFKDWFVDFGPTRAKMEGREAYLAPEIWSLFPDRLDEEGKPEGWCRKNVSDLYHVLIGRTPPRKEQHHFVSDGMGQKWLSIRDMANLQAFAFTTSEELTAEAVTIYRIPIVQEGTVLLSFKLTVGRVAIAAEPMCTNEAIANLVPKPNIGVGPYFTYSFLASYDYNKIGSTSSIANAFNSESVREMEINYYDSGLAVEFEGLVTPLFDRIKSNGIENRTLAATRDLLLPKLMSGETRVCDTEKTVGDGA